MPTPSALVRSTLLSLVAIAAGLLPAAAQSPPPYTDWYLAEGAQNAFFDEEILIANPTGQTASVRVTLLPEPGAGPGTTVPLSLGPASRHTLRLAEYFPDTINGAVSARVRSTNNVPIVVERSMYWPRGVRQAGHNAVGLTALSTTWHLAEGASGFWETFILLVNPNDEEAVVDVTLLPAAGGVPRSLTRSLAPNARNTIWINGHPDVPPAFANAEFSTTITANVPIAVERATYWDGFNGGTDSTGTVTPSRTWHFGEGATSGNQALRFETFLLLQNSNLQETTVQVRFFKDGGGVVDKTYTLPPQTRRTISVRLHVPELGATGFSTSIESTRPIIAERAMYWLLDGQPLPAEGHTVQGVTELAPAWVFAEGIQGRIQGVAAVPYETFFLVLNPHPQPLELEVTVAREDGTGAVRSHTVPAQSRYTLYMGQSDGGTPRYPEASNQRFATFIRSTDGQPFLAERAVYWGGLNGGHASAGVPWPWDSGNRAIARPGTLARPVVREVSPQEGRLAGGTRITIRGRGFQEGATVRIGNAAAHSVRVVNDRMITAVTPPAPQNLSGARQVRVTNVQGGTNEPSTTFLYTLRVLAFGDSITYGTTTICPGGSGGCAGAVATWPYPRTLAAMLGAHADFAHGVVVDNAGVPGECAGRANGCGSGSGEARLPTVLEEEADYDFMVLLEGVNDLIGSDPVARAPQARDGLRAMARAAKSRGIEVILCTLTPVEPERRNPSAVARLNDLIWELTNQEGLFRISWGAVHLSPDGLHPSQSGYDAMAREVHDKILAIRGSP